MDLSDTCTQAEFGELVGISQPAVSELLSRGVIAPGATAGEWLTDYCANLREQAAGRGGDGLLAENRAEESRVRKELLEIKLAAARKEVAPVAVLEQVLAHVGRQVRSAVEPLPVDLKKICPEMSDAALRQIEATVVKACNVAADMSLASLAEMDEEEGEGDSP